MINAGGDCLRLARIFLTTWEAKSLPQISSVRLRRDNIDNKTDANKTHFEIDKKNRKTIVEFGNEMP